MSDVKRLIKWSHTDHREMTLAEFTRVFREKYPAPVSDEHAEDAWSRFPLVDPLRLAPPEE